MRRLRLSFGTLPSLGAARAGSLSARLGMLATRLQARPTMTVGELLDALGLAGFALMLLVLAVPSFVPVPLLPTGVVCGGLLVLLAPQMARPRVRRVWAPAALRKRFLLAAALAVALQRAAPAVGRMESWWKPGRLRFITGAAARPMLGGVVFLLGLTPAVPVPFGNAPHAAALVVLAISLSAKDGAAMLVGLGISIAAMAWVAVVTRGFIRAAEWGFTALH